MLESFRSELFISFQAIITRVEQVLGVVKHYPDTLALPGIVLESLEERQRHVD
jgi:hypothetical protein